MPSESGGRRRHEALVVAGLLVLFATLGAARLNPSCLIEPDTPDYLFTSRGLATLRGYVEVDHPGEPPHTFRPPGLPLLLAPLALVRPYDVVAAKLLVLLAAVGLLWLVQRHAAAAGGPRALVLALVATSPYTLLHGTEVITEIPYVAVSVAVLLFLAGAPREADRPSPRRLAAVAGLLAFLPFLRTIGVALIGAVLAWGLAARRRRGFALAAGAALLPTLLWSWRNAAGGGPTYLGSIRGDLAASGWDGLARKAVLSAWDYVERLADVLLPGLGPGQPLYERFLPAGAPAAGLPHGAVVALGVLVLALAVAGALARRRDEGGAALLYAVLYVAALAVYPPKHERLAWPLVPLVWIYAGGGVGAVAAAIRGPRNELARTLPRVAAVAALALAPWQAVSAIATVVPNLQRLREGAGFYDRVPPMYYADWQAAGRWLAEHAPAHARVLTRHSDVGFTARRWQDSLRFEELSPTRWRQQVARFGARYLVVPSSGLGDLFFWPALTGDPVYGYALVLEAEDVRVYEITPNLGGTVQPARPDRARDLERCRRALERYPGRVDLVRRLAELLHESGSSAEALDRLQEAIRRRPREVGLHKTAAELLLDLERPAEALELLARAQDLPEAGRLETSLARLADRARRALEERDAPPDRQVQRLVDLARFKIEVLDWGPALEALERAGRIAPGDPRVAFLTGEAFQRLGRLDDAEALFRGAVAGGVGQAADKLALLHAMRRLGGDAPPATPAPYLELAELYVRDGTPGPALALLEEAAGRFPGSADVRLRLADLHLFYAREDRAAPLYRAVLAEMPASEHARSGLERAERLLAAPRF